MLVMTATPPVRARARRTRVNSFRTRASAWNSVAAGVTPESGLGVEGEDGNRAAGQSEGDELFHGSISKGAVSQHPLQLGSARAGLAYSVVTTATPLARARPRTARMKILRMRASPWNSSKGRSYASPPAAQPPFGGCQKNSSFRPGSSVAASSHQPLFATQQAGGAASLIDATGEAAPNGIEVAA